VLNWKVSAEGLRVTESSKPGGGLIVVHNRFAVVMFFDAVGRNPFTNNLTSKSQKPNVTSGQRWAS
jgi:hypothetical protein